MFTRTHENVRQTTVVQLTEYWFNIRKFVGSLMHILSDYISGQSPQENADVSIR